MQNLNLYNYYDKSLADINKDYLEAIESSRKVVVKSGGAGKIVIAFFLILLIFASGGYYFYDKKVREETIKARYTRPAGPDLRSTEEKLGYVKVQIFEFADEPIKLQEEPKEEKYESTLAAKIREFSKSDVLKTPERATAYDEKKKTIDSVNKIGTRAVATTLPAETAPQIQTPKETPNAVIPTVPKQPIKVEKEKLYAVIFEDIGIEKYDFLKKAGTIFKMTSTTVDLKPSVKTVWRLYRMTDSGDVTIGGKKASFIRDFDDKEEAITFAKDNKIQSIIRAEDKDNGLYSAKFCCTNLEDAKKFAENSNVTDTTIKIIREE